MTDYAGKHFSSYRLIRLFDQGEHAEVYFAEHQNIKKQVALKIPYRPQTRDAWQLSQTEARLLAHFDHPHIVHLLDFGEESSGAEHSVYLALEYAPHGTLRNQHPKGTQLSLEQVISYVKQVAAALQYLHDHQVLHRDIKPEHLLVGPHHQLLLCGFGAALRTPDSPQEERQQISGTLAYMALEQLQGHPLPASDQYMLGSVVYEWLTGEPPFRGPFKVISEQIAHASPPPVSAKRADIPSTIEHVVMRALEKQPEQRFLNVMAFANALEQDKDKRLDI